MRDIDELRQVQALLESGLNDCAITRATGIPRSTIRDWRQEGACNRRLGRRGACSHDPRDLPREQYAYLLGVYLGDGHISRHPRGVFRLRIFCDEKYPQIIDAIAHAMRLVRGSGEPHIADGGKRGRFKTVSLYWKHWPCLFPQHGPGMKWTRNIELADWQLELVAEEREAFLCGLIDSDGCRIVANYREKNGVRRQYGRYIFSNRSAQIHALFTDSLDALGIHWTRANHKDTAVARQADVRRLDQFIGPKE